MFQKTTYYILYLVLLSSIISTRCSLLDHSSTSFGSFNSEENLEQVPSGFLENQHDNIPVNIILAPVEYLKNKVYVSTGTNLTASAEILSEKFKNQTITYQWSTKNRTIVTDTNASQIILNFDHPDENELLKLLVFHKPNNTGVSERSLTVRNPISILDSVHKLFLERGELLKVSVKYNGSGPFRICHKICLLENADRDCTNCDIFDSTTHNEFNITHYLRYVGKYTLLVSVDNVASKQEKRYPIRISDTVPHHQNIPYFPIACSILAVIVLLVGVVLHRSFKRTSYTETADFDFIRHAYDDNEEEETQSFTQRVRYLLLKN